MVSSHFAGVQDYHVRAPGAITRGRADPGRDGWTFRRQGETPSARECGTGVWRDSNRTKPVAPRRVNTACFLVGFLRNITGTTRDRAEMWHVVFVEAGQLPGSRAARSRDAAIRVACELLAGGRDVRRILEPNGRWIERAELDEHYYEGRFPGLRIANPPQPLLSLQVPSHGSGPR